MVINIKIKALPIARFDNADNRTNYFVRKISLCFRAEDNAQWLREIFILAENLVSFPSTQKVTSNHS